MQETNFFTTPLFDLIKDLALVIIGLIGGFISSVLTEPVRQSFYKAKLDISFENNPDYRAQIGNREFSVRIKVENKNDIAALDCQAYLNNIEKADSNGAFQKTIFCDSIPLGWAYKEETDRYSKITLNKGVNQFLNVFSTSDSCPSIWEPSIHITPQRYRNLFFEEGVFRFTIQVTASNADPKIFKLILHWTRDPMKFETSVG